MRRIFRRLRWPRSFGRPGKRWKDEILEEISLKIRDGRIDDHVTGELKSVREAALNFHLGDSIMVLPEKRIGIVCHTADGKGMLRIQLPEGKRWISHKRLRLHVAADRLYPED